MSAPPPAPRRRRSPEEARAEALEAARRLLLEDGPEAVTLKAVAGEIGMSHANLLHHFGSAEGLQTTLMAQMVHDLSGAIRETVAQVRAGQALPRDIVVRVFDAFDSGGAGRLAAWLALLGDLDRLAPIRAAVDELVEALVREVPDDDDLRGRIREVVLFVTLMAFGDAVIGAQIREMLGLDADAGRQIGYRLLPVVIGPRPETATVNTDEIR